MYFVYVYLFRSVSYPLIFSLSALYHQGWITKEAAQEVEYNTLTSSNGKTESQSLAKIVGLSPSVTFMNNMFNVILYTQL
jgi:hypothetical protein